MRSPCVRARVVRRGHIDLGAPRREERPDGAVAAVDHAEKAAVVEVDERAAIEHQVDDPHPMRMRRLRQPLHLARLLVRQLGARRSDRAGDEGQDEEHDALEKTRPSGDALGRRFEMRPESVHAVRPS